MNTKKLLNKSHPVALLLFALPASAPAAVLSGSVVENLTSRPLARSRVTLEPRGGGAAQRNTLTRESGQFSFESLPAGSYILRAERAGYSAVAYGQRRPDEPGTPIVLQADSHFSVEIRLPRLGAVTGEVLDANQVGLPGIPVYAYPRGARLKAAAIAQSDDRGVYRLAGLRPGRYLVRTGSARLEDGLELLPTYYPSSPSADQAAWVEVRLDREVAGLNIAPRGGRLANVEGIVVGGGTETVSLLSDEGRYDTRLRSGGGFKFEQVEPGFYALLSESATKDRAAFAELTVTDADAYAVLEMKPAPSLEVNCVASDGARVDVRAISVFLRPFGSTASIRAACNEKLSPGPGRWEFAVLPPPQFYLVSIMDASRKEDAHELTLKPAESRQITVLLGSKPALLTGKVSLSQGDAASGVMVFLKAVSGELSRRIGGIRSERADEAGVYRFLALPPGQYQVFATYRRNEISEEDWTAGLGSVANLSEGQEGKLDLTVTTTD
ncbi:MAG: carboxypeptidase regulatory-like domain-containing protein [Bryobacteraceae bacterium]|nr:carboxypeptidase regulatory-like domain-containing protein [Bryobacteraceae bacterium]